MEQAVAFLGHPHILSGEVVSGRKLGRTIGVPTANLQLPEAAAVLPHGVYACKAQVEQRTYLAVTNIGSRPTVGGHRVTVEPWILDFDGNLYEKTIYTSCCNTTKGIYYYTTYENSQITGVKLQGIHLDSKELVSYPLVREQQIRMENE